MIRATHLHTDNEIDSAAVEEVVLEFNLRHRRRITLSTQTGKQFLLDLESTTALKDGDVLVLEDDSRVLVRAKAERVIDIYCQCHTQLTQIAWHLGNRHLPTQIFEDHLRILEDHVIEKMLNTLGAQLRKTEAPFQPEGGAYAHEH